MGKRLVYAGCMVMALCTGIVIGNSHSSRLTSDSYQKEHTVSVPYGNPVEEKDYSAQADALRDALSDAGDKASRAATDAGDVLSAGSDAAEKVIETTENVSDAVSAGSSLVRSLLEKASDTVSRLTLP